MSETMSYTRALLAKLREAKDKLESAKFDVQKYSEEVLPLLRTLDPDKDGIVFELNGAKSAAYYQQNKTPMVIDTPALIAFLKRRKVWAKCSTEQLDMKKVEAEIAAGNIRAKDIEQFMSEGKTPEPYVRFMNPKRNSK